MNSYIFRRKPTIYLEIEASEASIIDLIINLTNLQ